MKVSDLTGALLDYWVAKAEDLPVSGIAGHACFIHGDPAPRVFRPSTDWSQGGPIIEREQIQVGLNFRITFQTPTQEYRLWWSMLEADSLAGMVHGKVRHS